MTAESDEWAEAGDDLWRGCCNAWECDEMGHQNVRFYMTRAMEGMAELLARSGVPTRPLPGRDASSRVRAHHIRLMRELRPGAPTHLRGGFVDFSGTTATVAQMLYQSEAQAVSASFLVDVEYLAAADHAPAPWPESIRSRSSLLSTPDLCQPRGLTTHWDAPSTDALAESIGMRITGRGIIADKDCDHLGLFRPESVMATFADSTRILTNAFHEAAAAVPRPPAKIGSAGVECRMRYPQYPRSGDRYIVRGGIAELNERNRRVLYCLFDAPTGALLAELQTLEMLLDLDARRSFRLDPQMLDTLDHLVLRPATGA